MHHGVKSEGWLVTYRRGELETRQWLGWMRKTDKSRRTNTQQTGGRRNRTNRIKIRQKEIKVRMSDASVAAGAGQSISGTESTWRQGSSSSYALFLINIGREM